MADTFKIYKGTEVVAEGVSPLAITGIAPNTDIADGTYQATRVVEDRESEKVDIPAFKTLPVSVTGVTLNKTTLALAPEATEKLVATIAPDNATNKAMTWKSSDEAVTTVATDGTVTTVADGEATITVTTTDGSKTATCVVTVATPATRKQVIRWR